MLETIGLLLEAWYTRLPSMTVGPCHLDRACFSTVSRHRVSASSAPPARAVCNRNQSCTTSSFDETFTVSLNIWIGLNRRSSDWNVCKRLLILCITLTDTGVTTRVWDEIVHVTAAEPAPMLKGWNYCRVAPARSRFACRVYFWWKPRVGRCE